MYIAHFYHFSTETDRFSARARAPSREWSWRPSDSLVGRARAAQPCRSVLSAPNRPPWPGLLLAAAGAIAFAGKALIVKLAYRYGVDAITVIMYRMLFALPLFLLLSWWASRGRAALSARDWWTVGGLGFTGYYLASY